ncbi:hypothetical protein TSUD_229080 [Trifolium subterraneum]|uniref:AMP-dependent synthetase/ligase domain-containing protein n=1 Tax=Trifolium subterraneum TaxID=3900 RepID=A0A2Z6M9B9_TRISU|nr:hypothetical protein TSUD_229080 [Trifolium subterraneum]
MILLQNSAEFVLSFLAASMIGATGLPKGVILTHKSLITSVAQQVDGENPHMYLTTEDVLLCVLPLFHIFAFSSVLLCALRAGSAVLLMHKFEIRTLLGHIQKHKVTVAMVVPPLVLALAKNPTVAEFDLKAGPVLSMCLSFAKHPLSVSSGSCGTVVRNAELKILDLKIGGSLGYNQPGEICIRGQQIMKDDNDEIFIVDRVKELIKFKGFQVFPVAFVVRSNGLDLTEETVKEFIAKQFVFYKRLHKVYFIHAIPKSPSGKILRKDLIAKLENTN